MRRQGRRRPQRLPAQLWRLPAQPRRLQQRHEVLREDKGLMLHDPRPKPCFIFERVHSGATRAVAKSLDCNNHVMSCMFLCNVRATPAVCYGIRNIRFLVL